MVCRIRAGLAAAAAVAVLVPGAAAAQTTVTTPFARAPVVSVSGGDEANDITISTAGAVGFYDLRVDVQDPGGVSEDSGLCYPLSPSEVYCDVRFDRPSDRIEVGPGAGDDVIDASGVDDVPPPGGLVPPTTPPPVVVQAGHGDDEILGGQGNDDLDGGEGSDLIAGLQGVDTADYASRSESVSVWLDGSSDSGGQADGPPGVRDQIASDVENLRGGGADDLLVGDEQANELDGQSGDDVLVGGSGADQLDGERGDDVLVGGSGADQLVGGMGFDVVDYSDRSQPVDATLMDPSPSSGNADDGPVGHRDLIRETEGLVGGDGNDTLRGTYMGDLLNGGPGADVLSGGDGEDVVDYSDRTSGVSVNLDGSPVSGNAQDGPEGARDRVSSDIEDVVGGSGDDTLTGNASENDFDAGAGNDQVFSRDKSADHVGCGPGTDTATADALDKSDACESVLLPAPPAPPVVVPPAWSRPAAVSGVSGVPLFGFTPGGAGLGVFSRPSVGASTRSAFTSAGFATPAAVRGLVPAQLALFGRDRVIVTGTSGGRGGVSRALVAQGTVSGALGKPVALGSLMFMSYAGVPSGKDGGGA